MKNEKRESKNQSKMSLNLFRCSDILAEKFFTSVPADSYSDFVLQKYCDMQEEPRTVLRMYSYAALKGRGVCKEMNELSNGKYLFRAELRIESECYGVNDAGAYLRIISDGQVIAESEHVFNPTDKYFWMQLPVDLRIQGPVQFQICLDGVGTVYVKDVKLQKCD